MSTTSSQAFPHGVRIPELANYFWQCSNSLLLILSLRLNKHRQMMLGVDFKQCVIVQSIPILKLYIMDCCDYIYIHRYVSRVPIKYETLNSNKCWDRESEPIRSYRTRALLCKHVLCNCITAKLGTSYAVLISGYSFKRNLSQTNNSTR